MNTATVVRATFQDLARREPRLLALLEKARRLYSRFGTADWEQSWYGQFGLKRELVRLVGWGAEVQDPLLQSCEAYDLAYHAVLGALCGEDRP